MTQKKKSLNAVFEDYETKPVPEEKRGHWWGQGMVWTGIAFCLIAFVVGGQLGAAMDFKSVVIAVISGALILTAIASLVGVIGARTHLTATMTARFSLGVYGAKIFGIVIMLSNFGWYGYQCNYFGSSAVYIIQLFTENAGTVVMWTLIGGFLMCVTAIIGFKGIKWLSNIGVPLLFILVFVAFFITLRNVPMETVTAASQAAGLTKAMTIPAAMTTVIGSFVTTACYIPDISRYSKRDKDAVVGSFIGFLISFCIIQLIGAYFACAYGTADLSDIFINKVGLGVFAGFVLIVATWTTNDNNLYSAILGLSNAIGTDRIPRWLLTAIFGILSTILGAFGLVNYFIGFLNILGVCIPPFGAAMIVDYYIYNRTNGLYQYENIEKLPNIRIVPFVSAAFGIVIGLLCTYTTIFAGLTAFLSASIISMIATLLCQIVLAAATKKGTFTV